MASVVFGLRVGEQTSQGCLSDCSIFVFQTQINSIKFLAICKYIHLDQISQLQNQSQTDIIELLQFYFLEQLPELDYLNLVFSYGLGEQKQGQQTRLRAHSRQTHLLGSIIAVFVFDTESEEEFAHQFDLWAGSWVFWDHVFDH